MKKHITFILLLTVSVCYNTYSQFLYTKQGDASNNFLDVMQEPGTTNLLVTCNNFTYVPSSNYINQYTSLLKINASGVMIDSFKIGDRLAAAGRMLYHQNYYYIYGFEASSTSSINRDIFPTLYKYDLNFNEVARIKLDSVYVNFVSSLQSTVIINNKLYLCYYYGITPKAKLFKLSLNLNIIDSISFQASDLTSMIKQGSNLLIGGSGFAIPITQTRSQALKLDTNFNTLSYFSLDSLTTQNASGCSSEIGLVPWGSSFVEISNNSYYASGFYPTPYSNCTDDDQVAYGIIRNTSTVIKGGFYGTTGGVREGNFNYNPTSIRQGKHIYNVCMSGMTDAIIMQTNFTPTKILTAKIDTVGNIIWQKYFDTQDYYYQPMAVNVTSDSSIVITGMRYNTTMPSLIDKFEGFVLKYDQDGNILYTSVEENKNPVVDVSLFPNPTITETSLSFSLVYSFEVKVRVLNNVGQVVQQTISNLNAGSNKINIDTKNLSSGIYNVLIESKNGTITKKLSVSK